MNYILFDGPCRNALLPLTYTRPVAEIRIGILTIKEKWERFLGTTVTLLTEEYLQDKFPIVELEQNIFIDATVLPTSKLVEEITFLSQNELLLSEKEYLIAFFSEDTQEEVDFSNYIIKEYSDEVLKIESLQDIFLKNQKALELDYELITQNRTSQKISETNNCINSESIFIEEGAVVEFATLNASNGPIYIGKDTLIMEGTMIRGPFALCEKSVVKMGAKVYGTTTVGPKCTIGGEIKNVIFTANSNKGHDGYLGDSVVGEWCNFGANTNVSNLKNTYSEIAVWNYETETFEKTGTNKFGLIMGDHSKTGINTMINTGTIVGVSCNIFGANFPDKFLPSFTWGIAKEVFNIEKALQIAKRAFGMKGENFTQKDEEILNTIFNETQKYRA